MMKGQQDKGATLLGIDGNVIRNAVDVGFQVGVTKHDALRRASCARGIDDEGRVVVVRLTECRPGKNGARRLILKRETLVIVDNEDLGARGKGQGARG